MREILFRGKRADTGEWIYGDLRQDADLESAYIGGWDYFTADYALQREPFEYPVSPETVGQFTGLTDKNGNRIFEGDICSTDLKRPYTVVAFRGGCFEYELDDGDGIYYDIMMPVTKKPATQDKYTIVIGNIYDNADLLGENNAKEQ